MTFIEGHWCDAVDVRDFIQRNYAPYTGGAEFLAPPTERTVKLWSEITDLLAKEREAGGVLDIDEHTISDIDAYQPGYIDKDLEQIVGLQTDAPLKRAIMPFGGIRLVRKELETYGRTMDPEVERVFQYRKTHNDGVFDVYTDEIRKARHNAIITGLPDAYGRGRIIGDYRRTALYGTDFLIEQKKKSLDGMTFDVMDSPAIRLREELQEQIRALKKLARLAQSMAMTFPGPRATPRRPSSGSISHTWQQSRSRTALRCLWAVSPLSWIFMRARTWRRAVIPRRRSRR